MKEPGAFVLFEHMMREIQRGTGYMTKKIAVINDLSGFGKCSLTAAISVIAAMGVQPCPLPTAVLSAQTGYPSFYCDDLTDKMELIYQEWKRMKVHFDGIYTGFMSSGRQIRKALEFVDLFCHRDTFLLVDPIMGDNGERFSFITPEMQSEMKALSLRADIITPNLTELCLLTDTDYHMIREMTEEKHLMTVAEQMARNMISAGTKEVVVTGIRYRDESGGREIMANLAVTRKTTSLSACPFIGESYSGTGDLFASVIAGGRARGDSLFDSVKLAGEMIGKAVEESVKNHVPRNEGVDYEKYLKMVM